MKKTLVVLTLLLGSVSAWADRPPVDSLNDLPARWEGVAGDLLNQVHGGLVIERILRVTREDKSGGFTASYEVDARLVLGSRTITIEKVDLNATSQVKSVYWLTLHLKDNLVPRLWAAVTYDEATNTYTLKEMPRQGGERRFVFQAQASK